MYPQRCGLLRVALAAGSLTALRSARDEKGRVDVIAITVVMSYLVRPSFQEALKHDGGMLRLCKIITHGIQQNVSV